WDYQSSAAKAIANAYAAMPSLHFGWSLWCAIVIWTQVGGRRGHVLAVLYPTLTLFAIVITANHFFLDAVGGALILCGGLGIVRWSERRRSARLAPALTGATAEQLATAQ
ncbi:MAG: PAP2 family protein, partial [Actinobacteria bacterium]|nr:PAP2 family protein [Actinomycetota bacterium]